MKTEDTQADPLALARECVQTCKQAFTHAAVSFMQAKPNADQRATIALRNLAEARARLAALEQINAERMEG